MCFSVSNVYNLNQYLGNLYHTVNDAIPSQEEVDECIPYHRQNDLKCLAAGGCTFAGALLPIIGGWFCIIMGATCGTCGNLASYRFSRTTQAQLDLIANVNRLVKKDAESNQVQLEILEKVNKLVEENALFKAKIAELEKSNPLCENCRKTLNEMKLHVIDVTPVVQLKTPGEKNN